MDYNFMQSILDEVALEGLDGITLQSLWVRLENRPKFPIKIDNDSKAFIWKSIAVHNEVEIFELPEPRPVVQIYNRYEHVDDLGLVLDDPVDLVDIYPVVMVSDKKDVRGSCATYHTRKNVSSFIRDEDSLLLTLSEVRERWADKLVLVASARVRLLSLIGPNANPLIEMTLEEYCFLERLGRSRYLGEVTQGEKGLLKLNAPFSKQLHYYRKKLGSYGLITKQKHFSRSAKGIATSGTLLHLSRFFVQRKSKMELLMELMCDILKDKPNQIESCLKLKQEMNISYSTFKKLINRNVERWLKVVNVPSSELEATDPGEASGSSPDKTVKAVKLIKHCREESLDDDKEECLPATIYYDSSKAFVNYPVILQAYRLIQEAGPQGLSIIGLANKLTVSKLDSRMILKALTRQKLIVMYLHEVGRQKINMYIAANLGDQNEDYTSLQEGKEKTGCGQLSKSLKRKSDNCAGPSTSKHSRLDEDVAKNLTDTTQKNETDKILSEIAFQQIEVDMFELENFEDFSGKLSKVQNVNDVSTSRTALQKSNRMTLRKLKRTHMIVDYVSKNKFTTLVELLKFIKDAEKEEGYAFKMDKKSVLRLLPWLFMLKKIILIKAVLKLGSQKTELEFICDPSVKPYDPVFKPVVDEAKLRLYSAAKDSNLSADKFWPDDKEDDEADVAGMKIDLTPHQVRMLQNFKNIRKFARFKKFHMFLYYLVHGYEGCAAEPSQEPVVYHQSMTWKRFIPPLPEGTRKGWCFVADVIKHLPLYVFVYSVNMWEKITEFAGYLFDEERCNYLITQLPKRMLNVILHRRQYIFRIDEILRNLSYMGLVSFGPQTSKIKSHTYIYVHKVAKFKDTSKSPVGYMYIGSNVKYEEKEFVFNTMAEVEKYWIELEKVCSETRLASTNSAIGQTFEIVGPSSKSELIEATRHKSFDEVTDVGFLPGDGRGAAGLDSSLYAHYNYNWRRKVCKVNKIPKSSPPTSLNPTSYLSMKDLLKKNKEMGPGRLKRLSRLRVAALKNSSEENKIPNVEDTASESNIASQSIEESSIPKLSRRKKVVLRTVKQRRKKKERAPYLDEKDKAAIKKMSLTRARAEWTAQEDSFLLLCKVASVFLDHPTRSFVVPYTVVRDLLHEHCPEEGSTKTSRSCQRRIKYMMMNPTTLNNVSVFLGEAKQDSQLVQDFSRPAKSTDEAAWAAAFAGLLKRLVFKFSMPASDRCKVLVLPDSKELFEKHFDVITPGLEFQRKNKHKDPSDEMDVRSSVMYSFIFSVLAVEKDFKWTYLLHKLHQNNQYTFDSVVSSLRNEKVLATTFKGCKRDSISKLMASLPYRYSIVYENNLITKFSIKLLVESKELLDRFKESKDEVVGLGDDIPPGYTVAVTSLVMLNEIDLTLNIPDHIILFDSDLSKETRSSIVERMMQTLSDKESSELASMLKDDKRQPLCNLDEEEFDYESGSKKEALSALNEMQHSKNASRFALYLLRQELSQPIVERTQHSQDYIILNSCEILGHLKKSSFGLEKDFQKDSCPVESSTQEQKTKILTDKCLSEIKASIMSVLPPAAFSLYQNFDEPLEMIYDPYSAQTLKEAKDIFAAILNAGPVGISEKSIWKQFATLEGELSLFEHLQLFREAMLTIRAGIASFVYVCISFAKLWTLQSYVLPEFCYGKAGSSKTVKYSDADSGDSESSNDSLQLGNTLEVIFTEEVYFLPRTWRCPDGSLNKKVFLQLLRTVFSYITHYPSVSSSRVVERFSTNLQPVQTLELIEILERGCCVVKYFSRKPKKGGLFSPPSPVVITENPDPDDVDHLEPLPDAICNLSKIEDSLM